MSYARFSATSDVYVFHNSDGYYECCACELVRPSPWLTTAGEMIEHLERHRAAGHLVPLDTLEALREEHREELEETP